MSVRFILAKCGTGTVVGEVPVTEREKERDGVEVGRFLFYLIFIYIFDFF